MELVETRTQAENASEVAQIKEAIRKLVESNPNGGEKTLNEICKLVPNASRSEVVQVLKKSKEGVFVTGRRGRLSRFLHGPPAMPFMTRANMQTARPAVHLRKETVPASPPSSSSTTRFELRIGVGGQITTIPIDIDLALAAA